MTEEKKSEWAIIPPKDKRVLRIEKLTAQITQVIETHGCNKKKAQACALDIIEILKGSLGLTDGPTKGATVMTEAASDAKTKQAPANL